VKLSAELSKVATGRTLYILDEPTTGLHFADIEKLLEVLQRLVDAGNTVLVIEHNLDVIKQADWIIDLGPEGGRPAARSWRWGRPRTSPRWRKAIRVSSSGACCRRPRSQPRSSGGGGVPAAGVDIAFVRDARDVDAVVEDSQDVVRVEERLRWPDPSASP
jgi:energy-coupling factor transporter ATP-binding protein EcfA2